jgi:hypothetical protein
MPNVPAHLAAPPPVPLKVIGYDRDVAVGILGDVVLLLWRKRITAAGVEWTRQAFESLLGTRAPETKIAFVTALEPECDLNTPAAVRKGLALLLKSHEARLACAAIVFAGDGFGMTIVRSIITAINIIARSRFPNAVFGRLESALQWLDLKARAGGVDVDRPRIVSSYAQLRAL